MIEVSTSVTAPVVSRANNRRTLEEIDADVDRNLKAMVRSEEEERNLSSKIVRAGVLMLEIRLSDSNAWDAFKSADPDAKKIACKGKDLEAREVASVLWRRHRAKFPSRERISLYGRAIKIAYNAYYKTGTTKPEALLTLITTEGGVKGLIKTAKTAKGCLTKPKQIRLDRPSMPTLILIRPDGTYDGVPTEIARPVLIEMGALQ